MKYRTDFVTNSSSSSFIVAHNNIIEEDQIRSLVKFALNNFLGDFCCSTEEDLAKHFNKFYGTDFKVGKFTDSNGNLKELFDTNGNLKDEFAEEYDRHDYLLYKYIACLKEIKQSNFVNFGSLNFEGDNAIYTLQKFWAALKGDNFKTIDDDLDF